MSLFQTLTNTTELHKYSISGENLIKQPGQIVPLRNDISYAESVFLHNDLCNNLYITGTGDKISNLDFLIADHGHFIETFALFMRENNLSNRGNNLELYKYILSNGSIDFNSLYNDIEQIENNLMDVTNLVTLTTFENYFILAYETSVNGKFNGYHNFKKSIDGKVWDSFFNNKIKYNDGTGNGTPLYIHSILPYNSQKINAESSNFKKTFVMLFGEKRIKEGYADDDNNYYIAICNNPDGIHSNMTINDFDIRQLKNSNNKHLHTTFKYDKITGIKLNNYANYEIYPDNIVKLFTSNTGIFIFGTMRIIKDNGEYVYSDHIIYHIRTTDINGFNTTHANINTITIPNTKKVLDLYEYDDVTYAVYNNSTQDDLFTDSNYTILDKNRLETTNIIVSKITSFSTSGIDVVTSPGEDYSITMSPFIYKTTFINSNYIIFGGKFTKSTGVFDSDINTSGIIIVYNKNTKTKIELTDLDVNSIEHIEYMEHHLFAFGLKYTYGTDANEANTYNKVIKIDTIILKSIDGKHWEHFSTLRDFVYNRHKKNFFSKK